jgi:cell division protease FtsH
MVYGQKDELIFLGREISEQRDYSESVAEKIDIEVRQLVQEAFDKAKTLLNHYRTQLEAVAERLIEVETIDRAEFERIFTEPVPTKNGGTPVPVPAHSSA